jgi:DNA invertase Pin-like site-specific DNA recombinase
VTRALLYLRKSTDEHQADSIDTQRAGATAFVTGRLGGIVVREIVDEGESRAEFKRRPGWSRMLALCAAKERDFDAIVVRDESRLGAGARLTVALDDILAAGIRVWHYASGQEVQLSSAEEKIMVAIKSAMAENERAKTAERTREALERKAKAGLNVGGIVYGYDNIRITDADGKARTEYRINEAEAKIVVEAWTRFAASESERTIAIDFNARGLPSPPAGKRGTGSWSPNAIREIVRRDRYRGYLIWGRVGAEYRGGTRRTFERKDAELVKVDRPDLRIVSEELHEAVQARIAKLKERSGGRDGFKGHQPRYLLSGKAISRCGVCGGPMMVSNSKSGKATIRVYSCAWRRDRGPAVCSNSLRRPVEGIDRAFIAWVDENVFTEELIVEILGEVRRRITRRSAAGASEIDLVRAEITRVEKEVRNLRALARGLDAEPDQDLANEYAAACARARQLRARLEVLETTPAAINTEVKHLEVDLRKRIDKLRAVLSAKPIEARRAVEALIEGPIEFHPMRTEQGSRYVLKGKIVAGALFSIEGDPDGTRSKLRLEFPLDEPAIP